MYHHRSLVLVICLIVCSSVNLVPAQPGNPSAETNKEESYIVTTTSPPPQNLINNCPEQLTMGTCQVCLQWIDPRRNIQSPQSDNQKSLYSRYILKGTSSGGGSYSLALIVLQGVTLDMFNCSVLIAGQTATFQVAGQNVAGTVNGIFSNSFSVFCPTQAQINAFQTTFPTSNITNGISRQSVSYAGNRTFTGTWKQGQTLTRKVSLEVRCKNPNDQFDFLAKSSRSVGGAGTTVSVVVPGLGCAKSPCTAYSCKTVLTAFYPNGNYKSYVKVIQAS